MPLGFEGIVSMLIKHLEHVDDYVYTGHIYQSIDVLESLKDALSGKPQKYLKVSVKYDGAPAIVFGVNPENGKFFVGTKSVFNKLRPIICYDENDVQKYYGDREDYAIKLWLAIGIIKRDFDKGLIPPGVYQGDFMYHPDLMVNVGSMILFTPNTITYGAVKGTEQYEALCRSTIGIALHTQYYGPVLREMKSIGSPDVSQFKSTEVYWIDTAYDVSKFALNPAQHSVISSCLVGAEKMQKVLEAPILNSHCALLKQFTNYCIRIGEHNPNTTMYRRFVEIKGEEDQIRSSETLTIKYALQSRYTLDYVKRTMMMVMNDGLPFYHECSGDTTAGEGYVVTYHGIPTKLVDRMEFSRRNFHNMRFVCQR
jgi:hypothetical protein